MSFDIRLHNQIEADFDEICAVWKISVLALKQRILR